MPKKEVTGAGQHKKLPSKNEVKDVNKRLAKLSEDYTKTVVITADRVYSSENEIVNTSTLGSVKTTSPTSKIIKLDNELNFPMA